MAAPYTRVNFLRQRRWKMSDIGKRVGGRRKFLQDGMALGGAVALGGVLPSVALAQGAAKIKIGLMLPYTGTFGQVGLNVSNAFKLAILENGGKIAGREGAYFTVDDESEPSKATDNANRLGKRGKGEGLG